MYKPALWWRGGAGGWGEWGWWGLWRLRPVGPPVHVACPALSWPARLPKVSFYSVVVVVAIRAAGRHCCCCCCPIACCSAPTASLCKEGEAWRSPSPPCDQHGGPVRSSPPPRQGRRDGGCLVRCFSQCRGPQALPGPRVAHSPPAPERGDEKEEKQAAAGRRRPRPPVEGGGQVRPLVSRAAIMRGRVDVPSHGGRVSFPLARVCVHSSTCRCCSCPPD